MQYLGSDALPRVGIVTHYWPPHIGGIEALARDQAHDLAGRGWRVTVFSSRLHGDPPESQEGSVRIRRSRCTNVLENHLGVPVPLMAPSMFRELVRSARELDVLIAHGHVYVGTLYAALAARRASIPLLVVQHSPFVEYSSRLLNRIEQLADHTLGKAVFRQASNIIAVSDFTKTFVESIAPTSNVIRIHPGVHLNEFFPPESPGARNRPLFLTVRRLVARNGIDRLIQAWIDGGIGEHADLAIVGDGPLYSVISRLASNDPTIRCLGSVPDAALRDIYQGSDVFVLPTVSGEGYGLALAEALASGLPVIATDDGGARELVMNGVTGISVPPSDVSALASAMRVLATDRSLRSELASNARKHRAFLDRRRWHSRFETSLRGVLRTHATARIIAPSSRNILRGGPWLFRKPQELDTTRTRR